MLSIDDCFYLLCTYLCMYERTLTFLLLNKYIMHELKIESKKNIQVLYGKLCIKKCKSISISSNKQIHHHHYHHKNDYNNK